jgi:hypothetical protein
MNAAFCCASLGRHGRRSGDRKRQRRARTIRTRCSAHGHHTRRPARNRGRRRRYRQAATRSPHQRVDRLSHARFAGCPGKQSARRDDGVAAQALSRHVPAHRVGQLPRSLCAAGLLLDPAGRSEGQPVRQGGRGTARSLEGRPAEGRGHTLGPGSPRSTRPAGPRSWRTASRSA